MKPAISAFLVALLSMHAQATSFSCQGEENKMKATILSENGCPSGLVLLNVETMCIDPASPALKTLRAGKIYELCLETLLDPTKTTWMAHVFSAQEISQ